MKRVFLFLGMGSCVSTTKTVEPPSDFTSAKALNSVQSPVWENTDTRKRDDNNMEKGSKEESFFDSKPWLESDDEQDFYSVNGDIPPFKPSNTNGDHQGRRLSELFKESNFSSDSQTSLKVTGEEKGVKYENIPTTPSKKEGAKAVKSVKSVKHCLPSLVRSLSCGDRKRRPNPGHIAAVAS